MCKMCVLVLLRITLEGLEEWVGETLMCAVRGTTQIVSLLFPMEKRTGTVKSPCSLPGPLVIFTNGFTLIVYFYKY